MMPEELPVSGETPTQEEKKIRREIKSVKDSQFQTILAAITMGQTELSQRCDTIDGKMGQLSSRQAKQKKDIENLKREFMSIKEGQENGSSSSGFLKSTSFTIRHSLFEKYKKNKAAKKTDIADQYFLDVVKRRVLVLGGYPKEMVREELEAEFKVTFISALGEESLELVEEIRAPTFCTKQKFKDKLLQYKSQNHRFQTKISNKIHDPVCKAESANKF